MALPKVPKSHPRYVTKNTTTKGMSGAIASKIPFIENIVGAVESEFPGFKDVFFKKEKGQRVLEDGSFRNSNIDNKTLESIDTTLKIISLNTSEIVRNTNPLEGLLKMLIEHVDDVAVETRVTHNLMRILNNYNKSNYDFMRGAFQNSKEKSRNDQFEELVDKTRFKRVQRTVPTLSPTQEKKEKEGNGILDLGGGLLKKFMGGGVGSLLTNITKFVPILAGLTTLIPVITAGFSAWEDSEKVEGAGNKAKAFGKGFGKQMWNYGETAVDKVGSFIEPMMTGEDSKGTIGRNILELMGNGIGILIVPFQKALEEYSKNADVGTILKSAFMGFVDSIVATVKSFFTILKDNTFLGTYGKWIDSTLEKVFMPKSQKAPEQKPKEPEAFKKTEEVPKDLTVKSETPKDLNTPSPEIHDKSPESLLDVPAVQQVPAIPKVTKKDDSLEKVMKVTILEEKIQRYKYQPQQGPGMDKPNQNIVSAPVTNNVKSNTIISSKGTRNPLSNEIIKSNISL